MQPNFIRVLRLGIKKECIRIYNVVEVCISILVNSCY